MPVLLICPVKLLIKKWYDLSKRLGGADGTCPSHYWRSFLVTIAVWLSTVKTISKALEADYWRWIMGMKSTPRQKENLIRSVVSAICSLSPWEDLCVFLTYLLFLLLMLSCFCGAKQGENWPEEMNSFNLESTWMAETVRGKWHEHVTKSLEVIFLSHYFYSYSKQGLHFLFARED